MALPRRACMGPTAPTAIIQTPIPTRVPTAITHTPVATAIILTIAAISGATHSHPNHRLVAQPRTKAAPLSPILAAQRLRRGDCQVSSGIQSGAGQRVRDVALPDETSEVGPPKGVRKNALLSTGRALSRKGRGEKRGSRSPLTRSRSSSVARAWPSARLVSARRPRGSR